MLNESLISLLFNLLISVATVASLLKIEGLSMKNTVESTVNIY